MSKYHRFEEMSLTEAMGLSVLALDTVAEFWQDDDEKLADDLRQAGKVMSRLARSVYSSENAANQFEAV